MGLFTICLRLKDEVNYPGLNWLKSPNKTMPAFGKLMRTLSRDSNRWFLSVESLFCGGWYTEAITIASIPLGSLFGFIKNHCDSMSG